MKMRTMPVGKAFVSIVLGAVMGPLSLGAHAAGPRVVELTQTACQFIESEGNVERGYRTREAADCKAINEQTAAVRVTEAQPLKLKPGKYVFRVANRDVPYELSFWLRPARLVDRISLPSVSGGGLVTGKTQNYAIELKPGRYLYSCPLNPTPDYQLIVEG